MVEANFSPDLVSSRQTLHFFFFWFIHCFISFIQFFNLPTVMDSPHTDGESLRRVGQTCRGFLKWLLPELAAGVTHVDGLVELDSVDILWTEDDVAPISTFQVVPRTANWTSGHLYMCTSNPPFRGQPLHPPSPAISFSPLPFLALSFSPYLLSHAPPLPFPVYGRVVNTMSFLSLSTVQVASAGDQLPVDNFVFAEHSDSQCGVIPPKLATCENSPFGSPLLR